MMSAAQKGAHARSFKWPWQSESSLTSHLISDVAPEIELSDYRRLPSSGSESPSGLLHGEGLKAEPIADLDLFFERLYNYYCEKGLWCIITKWIVEILTVIFVVCFIGFFLLIVDWHALRNAKCGVDAVESGQKPCDLAKEAINRHPLVPFTLAKGIIIGSMVILTIYGLFNFLKFFVQFKNIMRIRHFYYNSLNVTDREIQTTPWPAILEKVIQLQKSQQLCVVKELSEHDVVMRIMRKENYLIGMLNKGVLAFPISWWVPGAGPSVNSKTDGRKNHLILTKILEWTLNWCIFQSMFDSKFFVQSEFLANPSLLKRRLVVVGIVMFLISPCLVIFMLVYLFLRHAEQFYNQPRIAFFRRWSNLSKWIFREFNEVDHLFKHRISNSVVHASNYLRQFPSPLISTIAKFIAFVSGGLAAVLIIIAILDESLVEGHIFGHKLVWYGVFFTTVTAISRAMVTDDLQVLDPEGAMSLVVQQIHYMPKRWRGKENSDSVRAEFETLFQYTGMMLLEEMASIFVTPYLLVFVVPKRVDDILDFISDFTVDIEGVGHVCSLSVFNFESHGNRKYGSPFDTTKEKRSSQGKMEKAFLSFKSTYPSWQPDAHGQQFLSTLSVFREQQMHQELYDHLPTSTWQAGTRYRSWDVLHDNRGLHLTGYGLGPLWSSYPDRRPHPYLLDLYYTSQPPRTLEIITGSPAITNVSASEGTQNQLQLQNRPGREIERDEDIWGSHVSDRLQSHFEASTSNISLRNDFLQHLNPERRSVNNWWDRPKPRASVQQGSFLEPPAFVRDNFHPHSDDMSDRRGSFLEPPAFVRDNFHPHSNDMSDRQGSFLEPPVSDHNNFSYHSDNVSDKHGSFLEPPISGRNDFSSHSDNVPDGQASFLEPPGLCRNNSSHRSDDVPDGSVGARERADGGARDWKDLGTLSRTMYMDDSDNDEGIDLHFADDLRPNRSPDRSVSDIFGNSLSIPVRIIPSSNDPVRSDRLL